MKLPENAVQLYLGAEHIVRGNTDLPGVVEFAPEEPFQGVLQVHAVIQVGGGLKPQKIRG